MDNVFTQIAFGFIPVTILLILMGIRSRRYRLLSVFAGLLLFVSSASMAMPRLRSVLDAQTPETYDALSLVYAVADEGSTELAKTLLEDVRAGYREEYTLAAARIAAASGDYGAAKALYLKAVRLFPETEDEYAALVSLSQAEDGFYGVTNDADARAMYQNRVEQMSTAARYLTAPLTRQYPSMRIMSLPESRSTSYTRMRRTRPIW